MLKFIRFAAYTTLTAAFFMNGFAASLDTTRKTAHTTSTAPAGLQTAESQVLLTPAAALEKLKQGNIRFLENKGRSWKNNDVRKVTSAEGQFPFAFIFNCIDSRTPPEIILDQGVGNIFTGRIAGNVIGTYTLASMEYAIQHAGAKLIVVMGHTQCGAIGAACTGKSYGNNLNHLLLDIRPAVSFVQQNSPGSSCDDPALIDEIAKQNVLNQMVSALFRSKAIREMFDQNNHSIVGAVHNIKTGKVEFFDIEGQPL